jgi:hypothetical protein
MQCFIDRPSFASSETHPACTKSSNHQSRSCNNKMQEIVAHTPDNAPRDDGRTTGGCELFTGLSASGSAKQHNGNVYNNSEHRTFIC